MDRPSPTAAAALIRRVRDAAGVKAAHAAALAGISKSRWSQIERGYLMRGGVRKETNPSVGLIARMACAIPGITPERMETEGDCPAAAEVMREILGRQPVSPPPAGPEFAGLSPGLQEQIAALPPGNQRLLAAVDRMVTERLSRQQSA